MSPLYSTLFVRRDIPDAKRLSTSSMLSPSIAFALPHTGTVYRKYSDGGLTNDEDFLVEASTGHIVAKAMRGSSSNHLAAIALYDPERPTKTPRVIQVTRPSVFQSKYTFEYEGMIYRWGFDTNSGFVPKRNRDLYLDVIEDASMDMMSDDRSPGLRRNMEHTSRPVAKFTRSRNAPQETEVADRRGSTSSAVVAEDMGRIDVSFQALGSRMLFDPKGLEILLVMTLAMVDDAVCEGIFKKRSSSEAKVAAESVVTVMKSLSTSRMGASKSTSKKMFGGFLDSRGKTVAV